MFPYPRNGEIVNSIFKAREEFYQEFLAKGLDYTKGYLSAYSGMRKFLAEQCFSGESNRYFGAKKVLEEMVKNKK